MVATLPTAAQGVLYTRREGDAMSAEHIDLKIGRVILTAPLTFLQAARIVGLGLNTNLFDRREVIAWADARIAEDPTPPFWLLALATSQDRWSYDAAQPVLSHTPTIEPELSCGVLLALMPQPAELAAGRLPVYMKFVYRVVRDLCEADWSRRILCDADQVCDGFDLLDPGSLPGNALKELLQEGSRLFKKYSLPAQAAGLKPIRVQLKLPESMEYSL